MSVHIEGMGVLGCGLAIGLHLAGHDFTWSDKRDNVNAWRASTGCIYPTGMTKREWDDYLVWHGWVSSDSYPWKDMMSSVVAPAQMLFNHKKAPHEAPSKITHDFGSLRTGKLPSFHMNVQEFVMQTRRFFAAKEAPDDGMRPLFRAHSFTDRRKGYAWGWYASVVMGFSDEIKSASNGFVNSLYLRPNKFQLFYAYPRPNTGTWYAGDFGILEKTPHKRDVRTFFQRWEKEIRKITKGLAFPIAETGELVEGWRPLPAKTDSLDINESFEGGRPVYTYPSMGRNGIRMISSVTSQALSFLSIPAFK